MNVGRVWCDAVGFEEALDAGDTRAALELYGGDLLRGFFLSDALEWDRWLEGQRARLRSRAAAAAWSLAEAAGANGVAEEAVWWGRRAVALAPGDEPRLRQLISLLDALGDRAGAVSAYEEAVERWARDLGIEPSAETRGLIQRIRSADPPEGAAARVEEEQPAFAAGSTAGGDRTDTPSTRGSPRPKAPELAAATISSLRRPAALATGGAVLLLGGFLLWPGGDVDPAGEPGAVQGAEAGFRPPIRPAAPGQRGDARAEYLRGRQFLSNLSAADFHEAREHFQRSLELDPTYAAAWSGLANAFIQLAKVAALPAGEAYPRARAAAERALALDPDLAEAHTARAVTLSMYFWQTEEAEESFRRAIALDPGSAQPRWAYAAHLRNLGRFDDALAELRQAQALDPFFAFAHVEEGLTLYCARRYEEALEKFRRFRQAAPGEKQVLVFIALIHTRMHRYDQALAALREMDPTSEHADAQAIYGLVQARMGRTGEARRVLARLEEMSREQRPVSPFHLAAIHVALGEEDRALDLLEEAAHRPDPYMRLLGVEPSFDRLRADPRFGALLARVGLAP